MYGVMVEYGTCIIMAVESIDVMESLVTYTMSAFMMPPKRSSDLYQDLFWLRIFCCGVRRRRSSMTTASPYLATVSWCFSSN